LNRDWIERDVLKTSMRPLRPVAGSAHRDRHVTSAGVAEHGLGAGTPHAELVLTAARMTSVRGKIIEIFRTNAGGVGAIPGDDQTAQLAG
jgi:hypothetical protein